MQRKIIPVPETEINFPLFPICVPIINRNSMLYSKDFFYFYLPMIIDEVVSSVQSSPILMFEKKMAITQKLHVCILHVNKGKVLGLPQ